VIELIHSGQDSRRSLAPAGHPGSGSNSRIGTTSTLAIISHKRYVSLSGRWKRGIFSRAKTQKITPQCYCNTAITKCRLPSAAPQTMTAHATEPAVPKPRVKRLRRVASGIRPNKPERRAVVTIPSGQRTGDFDADHYNFQQIKLLVETRQKCVDFMVHLHRLYPTPTKA
jgi:hypothetical protein